MINLKKEARDLKHYDKILRKPLEMKQSFFNPELSAKSSGLLISKKKRLEFDIGNKGIKETHFQDYYINSVNVLRHEKISRERDNFGFLRKDQKILEFFLKFKNFNTRMYNIVEGVRRVLDERRKNLRSTLLLPCDLASNIRFYGTRVKNDNLTFVLESFEKARNKWILYT